MIKHIVMWKLKENAGGRSKNDNAKMIIEKICSIKGKIPGMGALEVGIDFNRSAQAYDLALYSEFDSVRSLDFYQNHPEHAAVKDFIKDATEERCVVDYEV